MQSRRHLVLALLCLSLNARMYAQDSQDNALSLQGFSGVINTPNAHVQREGTFSSLYSNQRELVRGLTPRWMDNYVFTFGVFKFAEVGGRLSNSSTLLSPTGVINSPLRDLSLHAKLSSAPFTSHYRFSPVLAVGLQDPGSGQTFFKTTYVVGSADPFSWLRLSAGYGKGPDRMDGVFAGMELKPLDWVTLLGDYDTRNTNAAVRLTSPEIPYVRARLTATVSKSVHHNQGPTLLNGQGIVLSGGFTVPLNFKEHRTESTGSKSLWGTLISKKMRTPAAAGPAAPPSSKTADATEVAAISSASQASGSSSSSVATSTPVQTTLVSQPSSLDSLQERLVKAGFVEVRVGQVSKTLVVEYENIRYNHSELDAIGVVLGIVSQTPGNSAEDLRLVIKKKGLSLLQIETDLASLHSWLEGSTKAPKLSVSQELTTYNSTQYTGGNHNSRSFKPSIMVYPSLTTLVGTEYGLFDYIVAIRPELQVPLWKGATAVGRADIPVFWTKNFQDGQVYASYRTPAQVDRLMVFQAVRLAPGLVLNLGGGQILRTNKGTLNELNWNLGSGMNRIKIIQSYGRDDGTTRNVFLGSYRLLLARHDLAFEGTAGRFYAQDNGFMVSMQRFFGDTSLSLYFKDTTTQGDNQKWRQAGLRIDFPLTPRRDMKASPVQIRGVQAWSYSQETGLVSSGTRNSNYVNPSIAVVPDTTQSAVLSLYDRERLNEAYILSHTDRIRDSWQLFRNKL